jgi:hypothetical protein
MPNEHGEPAVEFTARLVPPAGGSEPDLPIRTIGNVADLNALRVEWGVVEARRQRFLRLPQ